MTYVYKPPTLADRIREQIALQDPDWDNTTLLEWAAWADDINGYLLDEATTANSLALELLQAYNQINRVRELATAWAALAPEDDWAEGGITDTYIADAGREILKALEVPDES